MPGFTCPCCGKRFDDMPLDIAFKRPDPFLRLSEDERTARALADDDYCMIDGRLFFIRGYLPVPIHDLDDVFGWGFWCKVSENDLKRSAAFSNGTCAQVEPFVGHLANSAAAYDDLEGLMVEVHTTEPDQRPTLFVRPCDHPLHHEQEHGITIARVHAILRSMFPDRY